MAALLLPVGLADLGGPTSFGFPAKCQAIGGRGGSGEGREGGEGGDIGTAVGDFIATGGPGEAGFVTFDGTGVSYSGAGGSSYFSGGAALVQNPPSFSGAVNGRPGRYGSGGSGGATGTPGGSGAAASAGGVGGHGLILITEWGGHGTITSS